MPGQQIGGPQLRPVSELELEVGDAVPLILTHLDRRRCRRGGRFRHGCGCWRRCGRRWRRRGSRRWRSGGCRNRSRSGRWHGSRRGLRWQTQWPAGAGVTAGVDRRGSGCWRGEYAGGTGYAVSQGSPSAAEVRAWPVARLARRRPARESPSAGAQARQ